MLIFPIRTIILRIWDTLELMNNWANANRNKAVKIMLNFFCSVNYEFWNGTVTWSNKSQAQN